MFTTREIIFTAVVPAVIALLVMAVAWRPWRRDPPVLHAHWGGAVATGMAFLAAYALLDGEVPSWPPAQARHWLFYLAAGLTMLGFFDSVTERFIRVPNWVRAEAALLACGCIVLCLFWSLLQGDTWTSSRAALWVVAMVVVMHLTWVSTEVLVDRLPRGTGPAILLVFTAGAALILMLSGSVVYGRLAGVMAMVAGGAVAVSLLAPGFRPSRGAVTVLVPTTVAIVFLGYHLSDVSAANASLVLSALLLPWLARITLPAGRKPWVRAVVAVALALIPVAIATWRAGEAFLKAQQQDSAGGELYTLRAGS